MLFDSPATPWSPVYKTIDAHYADDEQQCVEGLLKAAAWQEGELLQVDAIATDLVQKVRKRQQQEGMMEAFLHEYGLSSKEGVVLMCLAEALLRIPDANTADKLIRDKLSIADWSAHAGHSHSVFVNASTWGLMLTGKMLSPGFDGHVLFSSMLGRVGEPLVRTALKQAMKILAKQFVMERSIEAALKRSGQKEFSSYLHSFDMLGEAALTTADAEKFFQAYQHAINVLAQHGNAEDVMSAPGISIKLSALHPRYQLAKREAVLAELVPMLAQLVRQACAANVSVTIDAEEADRLALSLEIYEQVSVHIEQWPGFGLAVQAYQKRALPVLRWLRELSIQQQRVIPVRLVKGAYWDTEVKRAQEQGLENYPVFTRKENTDVSYLACARFLFQHANHFYPQLATHNAQTIAAVICFAQQGQRFEFQRLHGMGESLYQEVLSTGNYQCRVYAPVGSHEELLPYLVRRLLENGANTSFVNRIEDENISVEDIVADPVARATENESKQHPLIVLPSQLYGAERENSRGVNLGDGIDLTTLETSLQDSALPVGKLLDFGGATVESVSPVGKKSIASFTEATTDDVEQALEKVANGFLRWSMTDVKERAAKLRALADLLESHTAGLVFLCSKEAGRCIPDAISEVREAVDFCRYYAAQAEKLFSPQILPGPTGESNRLELHGRGVFFCISPWNFPIAIFTGQIAAALAAGNAVVAKPASQTVVLAEKVVSLFRRVGIGEDVLQLLPGEGRVIGQAVLQSPHLAGIAFTGSTQTARVLNRKLAEREGAILPFIAETGGQNVMIADSSALPQQLVNDAIQSAFNSAGQRCSALRVLFVQEEIADRVIQLLKGAMALLKVGDPALLSTDVGPVIDEAALNKLQAHITRMQTEAEVLYATSLPSDLPGGFYFAPHLVCIQDLHQLPEEVFGPVLHVCCYRADQLDQVIKSVNDCGYGLTLGIHSRVAETARHIQQRVNVGNVYINRNMIGAVVGVQPFGGQGLSGTGPKAGGPNYLLRFAHEKTISDNVAAVGGNVYLLGKIS